MKSTINYRNTIDTTATDTRKFTFRFTKSKNNEKNSKDLNGVTLFSRWNSFKFYYNGIECAIAIIRSKLFRQQKNRSDCEIRMK